MGKDEPIFYLSQRYGIVEPWALDSINSDLVHEIRYKKGNLSKRLRLRLESLPCDIRKKVVGSTREGHSPLFTACYKNNVEVAEYLIVKCGANKEQSGTYLYSNTFTPLCCACANGNFELVRTLVRLGADVNAVADCGSTPLLIACRRKEFNIVKYLIENGADIQWRNKYGQNCLIVSVRSVRLCQYLISQGADINVANAQGETALIRAAHYSHLGTTKLLLNRGAYPFARTRSGEDALQIACLRARSDDFFNHLLEQVNYPPERIADGYELLGATLFDIKYHPSVILRCWRQALHIRHSQPNYIQKRPEMSPLPAHLNAVEFSTEAELDVIAISRGAMRTQAFLIQERILGMDHDTTLLKLAKRGTYYEKIREFQRCIDFRLLALKGQVQKNSILDSTTSSAARAIVTTMATLLNGSQSDVIYRNGELPRFEDISATVQLLLPNIIETRQRLCPQTAVTKQNENYDCAVQYLSHLILISFTAAKHEDEHNLVNSFIRDSVHNNIMTVGSKQTLLHMSLSRSNIIESRCFRVLRSAMVPNANIVKLLLEWGISVNERDASGCSPLLIACKPENYCRDVVRILVEYGAHPDHPDLYGRTPLSLLDKNPENDIPLKNYISLQCMIANKILQVGVPYEMILPVKVCDFIRSHEPE